LKDLKSSIGVDNIPSNGRTLGGGQCSSDIGKKKKHAIQKEIIGNPCGAAGGKMGGGEMLSIRSREDKGGCS